MAPFSYAVIIALFHSYVGLHILRRGIIFVDIAMAQWAALGLAVAIAISPILISENRHFNAPIVEKVNPSPISNHYSTQTFTKHSSQLPNIISNDLRYLLRLGFALLCAILLTLIRFNDERLPHEAIIGILYVFAASLSILILIKAPHGIEHIQALLIGNLLYITKHEVYRALLLYGTLGIVHYVFKKPFFDISENLKNAQKLGYNVIKWDALFFAIFAVMVTESVGSAGVFVVFTYLIIPGACARVFAQKLPVELCLTWTIALVITLTGFLFSGLVDLPLGASIVVCGGGIFFLSVAIAALLKCSTRRF